MRSKRAQRMIGVDLDGTLAKYTGWKGHNVIGEPIPAMVKKVKKELAKGTDVRILTARAHNWKGNAKDAKKAVRAWCKKHLGKSLTVTNEKHPMMKEIWDDIARGVKKNEGIFKSAARGDTNLKDTTPKDDWMLELAKGEKEFGHKLVDYKKEKHPKVKGVQDHTPERITQIEFKVDTTDPEDVQRARYKGKTVRDFITDFDHYTKEKK